MEHFESNKNTFRVVLAPIFELLVFKKGKLKQMDWLAFVARTEASIKQNPQQFLGNELPHKSTVEQAITEIFIEFMEEERVEA
jgi:hypothetical protein